MVKTLTKNKKPIIYAQNVILPIKTKKQHKNVKIGAGSIIAAHWKLQNTQLILSKNI